MIDRHIILVDDTKSLAHMYAAALEQGGYRVTPLYSAAMLFDALEKDAFAPRLLILDVRLPDMDGLQILKKLASMKFDAPVIVITGHGSIHTAVEAMRLGASDFLVKPFPVEKLCESAARAMESAGLSTKAKMGVEAPGDAPFKNRTSAPVRAGFGGFIGISEPMQLIYDVIENAAKSTATVFITGASGTGKEICAEAIHKYSARKDRPFVAINCAAIPRELLESELFGHVKGAFTGATADREGAAAQAEGGTLFLDEIAEMAPDMQTKLLRFLQNLTYRKIGGNRDERANIRIVCATNKDPLEEIRKGTLRQDLYYRLHVIPIHMPPLKERPNDIIDLADYFLKTCAREEGKDFRSFSQDAEFLLTSFDWPGNVRQLQNIVRGIAVLHDGKIATAAMLPIFLHDAAREKLGGKTNGTLSSPASYAGNGAPQSGEIPPLWKVERDAIEQAIALCGGNIPKAATMLEISPSTIYRKRMHWEKAHRGPPAEGRFISH
ncbi:MAG: sigma-54 dependent transcriptional regulator [Micavibrio sp.]